MCQRDRQTDRQTDRDRETERDRYRDRETERERETERPRETETDREAWMGTREITQEAGSERVTTTRYRECECQDCGGMSDVLSARTGDDSVRLIRCMLW